ncbi:MAG: 4-alpha-glucanotransferase [Bacteroidales bacterium]|nr:4-alpha-glucanotransferase [Bacteroidales bacterium]
MTLNLGLEYHTRWGESLELECRDGRRLPMEYRGSGYWSLELDSPESIGSYRYVLVENGRIKRREWRSRSLENLPGEGPVSIRDAWRESPADAPFYSSAFTKVIFRRRRKSPAAEGGNVQLRLFAPTLGPDERLAVVSSLTGWQTPLLMADDAFPLWTLNLEAREPFSYKFVILSSKGLLWEDGPDRSAEPPAKGSIVLADAAPHFQRTPWKGAGVAVPLFSLRTENSFGIGEFTDIPALVDWAVKCGLSFIQLLPVNDTTMSGSWQDSYPYNANSSFALHPQFIHLEGMPKELQEELNALPKVDYERVNGAKRKALEKSFFNWTPTPSYRRFVKENHYWLLPYCVYSVIRDGRGPDISAWPKWSRGLQESVCREKEREVAFYAYVQFLADSQLREAVAYARKKGVVLKGDLPIGVSRLSADAWTHPELFHLDSQAGAPPDPFAEDGQNWGFPTYNWERMASDGYRWWKKRLKRMSAFFDAFRIDHILGFFRIWEIPIPERSGLMGHFSPALPYSGEELHELGFCPEAAPIGPENDVLFLEDPRRKGYFHPRIDASKTRSYAALGDSQRERFDALYEDFFYHRHNGFWQGGAVEKLSALLRSTGMLACGEDLGMIPGCVPDVMRRLSLLSLEIQRMPKAPGNPWASPASYPYLSVAATGTHDMNTLRAWWEEDPKLTERFWREALGGKGKFPEKCGVPEAEAVIADHLNSPSMLCILPLQDWCALSESRRYPGNPADERINVPAVSRYYWRYRMWGSLEDLIADESFCRKIRSLVKESGRSK